MIMIMIRITRMMLASGKKMRELVGVVLVKVRRMTMMMTTIEMTMLMMMIRTMLACGKKMVGNDDDDNDDRVMTMTTIMEMG